MGVAGAPRVEVATGRAPWLGFGSDMCQRSATVVRPFSSAALPVWLAVTPVLGWVFGVWMAPDVAARWAAKEGPIEHVSHAVLAVALVGWGVAAVRARGWARGLAFALASWCAVVLAEELDWGAVYGVHTIANAWIALFGRPNLHNAWGGGSYLLFGVPILGLIALGWRERCGVGRGDAVALGVIIGASLLGTWLAEAFEPLLDEVSEASLYLLLATMAWRAEQRTLSERSAMVRRVRGQAAGGVLGQGRNGAGDL